MLERGGRTGKPRRSKGYSLDDHDVRPPLPELGSAFTPVACIKSDAALTGRSRKESNFSATKVSYDARGWTATCMLAGQNSIWLDFCAGTDLKDALVSLKAAD